MHHHMWGGIAFWDAMLDKFQDVLEVSALKSNRITPENIQAQSCTLNYAVGLELWVNINVMYVDIQDYFIHNFLFVCFCYFVLFLLETLPQKKSQGNSLDFGSRYTLH